MSDTQDQYCAACGREGTEHTLQVSEAENDIQGTVYLCTEHYEYLKHDAKNNE